MCDSKRQVVEELHRSARKNFPRRKTIMYGINDTYQIDLVEMIPLAKFNNNYKYILTIIDVFSKYAFGFPIKTKSAINVTCAMKKLFQSGNIPRNIFSDFGREFYNTEFKQLMRQYNVNHYSTFTSKKGAIVERFNRTLKTNMWKYFNLYSTNKWVNVLQSLIDAYNNSKHSTIGMKPKSVNKRNEKKLLHSVYNYASYLKPAKYSVGNCVRISKYKHIFEKGYTPNWTTEIFKIVKIQQTQPVTYLLSDYQNNKIQGAFYEEELQGVKHKNLYLFERIIKKRGDKLFVKWLGFDSTHNSWISASDIE